MVTAWAGRGDADDVIVGVLDLDCAAPHGFDSADVAALTRLAQRMGHACDWHT